MKNINLIRKIAWNFYNHKTQSIDWDDLFQQASLAYLEALKSYNPDKGKLSTYMWTTITNNLKSHLSREERVNGHLDYVEDIPTDLPKSPDEFFDQLTDDTKEIAESIIRESEKFICLPPDEIGITVIQMFSKKWEEERILMGLNDLKTACTCS